MNLGKSCMPFIFKNSNKTGKKDNASIKFKYLSLFKKNYMKNMLNTQYLFKTKNQRPSKFSFYLKNCFRHIP